ncbi:antitoxin Xre/MbcA/ParS toxin-binding domain-containing protein [Photobacterium leiognathi]|uniref:antitoxin Xre/MbcA/ParS toxin-binding domain-containing protein n=1 Tax=Photobacterium leiognathi TaxID=553611 RepID=UPI0029816E0C|nr:antitoxin Xre/MbcA/ParS toxin-binding domain-containing protein [Photobacterium leiognathi]
MTDVTTNSIAFGGNTPIPANIFNNDKVYYQAVVKGLSGKVVKWAVTAMPKQKEAIVKALGTTSGNLSRLYSKDALDQHQSEQMLDVLKLYVEVCDVLGSTKKADLWLSISAPVLNGEKPIDLMDTFIGRKMVREVVNKIRFGDFS